MVPLEWALLRSRLTCVISYRTELVWYHQLVVAQHVLGGISQGRRQRIGYTKGSIFLLKF